MKRKKLKPFVVPVIYGMACASLIISIIFVDSKQTKTVMSEYDDYVYVNGSILKKTTPVTKDETTIVKPYTSDKVEVSKKFYDMNASDEEKQNAIIYYNDTYIQNTGVLYKASESFDVISILDGTVVSVKKDEVLGNVVEVKHSNNMISTYQGLSTVNIKKDQLLKQGDVIGKSGNLNISEQIENGLLFELIYDGKIVNPENYFDKKINEL